MSAIAVPISRIGSNILPQIGKFFTDLFKSPATTSTIAKTGGSISRNAAITGASIFGTTLASSLFFSTPQGQNTLGTIDNITNLGGSINDLFVKNPIIPIGLLVLGGLVVVSVIKK